MLDVDKRQSFKILCTKCGQKTTTVECSFCGTPIYHNLSAIERGP